MSNNSQHYVWPDLFKTIGIFAVILQHSWEINIQYPVYSHKQYIFYGVLSASSRVGVPLFIFITGYFSKNYSDKLSLSTYWHRKIPKFLITATAWFVLIWIFQGNWLKHLPELLGIFLVGPYKGLFTQFWYVPLAITLWLILPFISLSHCYLKFVNKIILIGFCILPFIYDTILDTNNQFHWLTSVTITNTFPTTYWGYISLACIGYCLVTQFSTHQVRMTTVIILSIVFLLLGLFCNVLFTIYHFKAQPQLILVDWYTNIWNVIFAMGMAGVLLFCSQTKLAHQISPILAWIAHHSMAVFFCHYLILKRIIFHILPILSKNLIIRIGVSWLGTVIISFIVVWLISFIPILRKILVKD